MWDNFQISDFEFKGSDTTVGLAGEVLSSFGIRHSVNGGSLNGVNIKNANPLAVIKASLLEQFVDGNLMEIRVTSDGEVVGYEVGGSSSSFSVYYSTRTSGFTPINVGVQVSGKKPRPSRTNLGWKSVIGDGNSTIHDVTNLSSTCLSSSMSSVATITYKDPILTSGKGSFNDGVDNLFELSSPWESIVGFAWNIDPGETNEFTTIKQSSISNIPILVSDSNDYTANIGDLAVRKIIEGDDCFAEGGTAPGESGVPVVVSLANLSEGVLYKHYGDSTINTFTALTGVYVVGVNLYRCCALPKDQAALFDNNSANSTVIVASENRTDSIYRLSESEEYTINYKEAVDTDVAKIQFAQNTTRNDFGDYGTNKEFKVQSTSTDLEEYFQGLSGSASIMPTKNNGGGLLIKQVWAEVVLDSPCFIINDPTGDAVNIARNFQASLTAIVIKEEPTPIAINGELINQEDGIADNDPSTVQSFSETELEQAMKKMKGRTLNINMASLDASQTTSLSANLYSLLKKGNSDTYTHICSPNSTPVVGTSGKNGGIVNKINYSYQDQGSYLITVTEGPTSYGDFSGISGGMYKKRTEDVSAVGTVMQHDGSHIYFKVNVDGVGPVMAINAYPGVIGVQDRVSVTIHNNPVEG